MHIFGRKKNSYNSNNIVKEKKPHIKWEITGWYIAAFLIVGLALGLDIWALVRAHSNQTSMTMDVRNIEPETVFAPMFERVHYTPDHPLTISNTSLFDKYKITRDGYKAYKYYCFDELNKYCIPFYNYTVNMKDVYQDFPHKLLYNEATPLLNGSLWIKSKDYVAAQVDPELMSDFVKEVMISEKIMRIVSISITGTLMLFMAISYLYTIFFGHFSSAMHMLLMVATGVNYVKAMVIQVVQLSLTAPSQRELMEFFQTHYQEWGIIVTASRYDNTLFYISIAIFVITCLLVPYANLAASMIAEELFRKQKARRAAAAKQAQKQCIQTV